ncbi:MAG: ABC transporter permease, partial [Pseudomonadota bacterium]|nr:ABC transporter permease [Pseudomonadota bacterium]
MIRTLPSSKLYKTGFNAFIISYFVILFSPLLVVCILAFNDSMFPSLPWRGFTLDWFVGDGPEKIGIFNDPRNMKGIWVSLNVAFWVTLFTIT